jgi:MFS transporter, LPLT family, lysophospholipid transporter
MNASKNYPLLLIGQFLGAFGDNFLLAGILAPLTFLMSSGSITEQQVNSTNALFSVVFFLPAILLAPLAGFLNDRMPKTSWLLGGNLVKILGTLVGFIGVAAHAGDGMSAQFWQTAGYAIVGIGACLYSPAKYGILPEVVPVEKLVKANGMVETLTLVAILGGLGCGAVMYDRSRSLSVCYWGALALYGLATLFNGLMTRTVCNPSAKVGDTLKSFFRHFGALMTHRRISRILLGCALFWLAGAFMRTNLHAWGLSIFTDAGVAPEKTDNEHLMLLKVGLVLGIVAGSILAGRLHRTGDLSKQWLYALGLAATVAVLGLLPGRVGFAIIIPFLCLAGVMAGLLVVPFNAALQNETDHSVLGKTIAVQNVTDNAGMLLGLALLSGLTKLNWNAHGCFLGLAGVIVLLTLGMKLSTKAGDGVPARL